MGTRANVFTDPLNLGHEKVTKKRCGKSAMGMFDGREVVFALSSSSSDTAKSCLVVEQNVDIAAVVTLPGVSYGSLHGMHLFMCISSRYASLQGMHLFTVARISHSIHVLKPHHRKCYPYITCHPCCETTPS